MMEVVVVVVVTAGATRCAKLQSDHHHQQINTQFLQAGCPSGHPTNSVKAFWEISKTLNECVIRNSNITIVIIIIIYLRECQSKH